MGINAFLDSETLAAKRPRFGTNPHFDTSVFGEKFDFFLAYSIWTHASKGQIQAMLDSFVAILGTALYAVISWQCVKYAINLYQIGEVSPATATPFYPFVFAVAFGLLMLALVLLNDVFKSIGKIFK